MHDGWEVLPATDERFEDLATVINPRRNPKHCWCLAPRFAQREIRDLGGDSREEAMRELTRRRPPPGVLAYRDGEPVGWCGMAPRSAMPRLARSEVMPAVDDVPVWSIVCLVVRVGHRRQGVTGQLIDGAVAYAASHGAPAVEAYPVDPEGGRVDQTMAYVGTVPMFERVGFRVIGETRATSANRVRWVVRRDLVPDAAAS
ncbi:GNAT family N-acetyltransferase [Ornithinicoccus halotolerans]|uniref:GNAT family N-acetyltransferase n=1 Tax=Ornithinicoccus halotolerans TaxID=1748220 RepID=UPI001294A1BE|nr:GNAT family N-acetyltransferase [Ornithinicoccus halotolerans]